MMASVDDGRPVSTAMPAASGSGTRDGWWRDLLTIAAVWLLMVLVTHPVGDFPINDDWVYGNAVRTLLETGRFHIAPVSSANVGPQILWGALFAKLLGFSYTSLRLSTLILGLGGAMAVYGLYREVWGDRCFARVAALAMAVNPVYFACANTFMTDVPFVALMAVSMQQIAVGFRRGQDRSLLIGVAIAVVGILLRQFAIVVLLGFALAYLVSRGVGFRSVVVATVPLVLSLTLNWLAARYMAEPGARPGGANVAALIADFSGIGWRMKSAAFLTVSYVGLFLIPLATGFISTLSFRAEGRPVRVLAFLLMLAIGFFYLMHGLTVPVGGNVLNAYGIGPLSNNDTLIDKQNLPAVSSLMSAVWVVVTMLSIVSSALFVAAAARSSVKAWRACAASRKGSDPEASVLFVFFATIATAYVALLVLMSVSFTLLDRYFLPLALVGGLALPVLRDVAKQTGVWPARWSRAMASACIALTALFSVVATHDFLVWSGVRWGALQALVAEGVSPDRIEGGYEFGGFYRYDSSYQPRPGRNWWWVHEEDFQSSSGPLDGYHTYRSVPVERWWNNGPTRVEIIERDAPR